MQLADFFHQQVKILRRPCVRAGGVRQCFCLKIWKNQLVGQFGGEQTIVLYNCSLRKVSEITFRVKHQPNQLVCSIVADQ
jgi:hypothetical protein